MSFPLQLKNNDERVPGFVMKRTQKSTLNVDPKYSKKGQDQQKEAHERNSNMCEPKQELERVSVFITFGLCTE